MARPTKMTPEIVAKLEQAFTVDANISEACRFAGISRDAYYDYINKNPKFTDKVEELRGMTGLKAKVVIEKSINDGDKDTAKWHLERRDPEYKPKSSQDHTIGAHKSLIDAILSRKAEKE